MDHDRLEHARWILERNLHWISAVESKTAIVVSVDLAMLGALALSFGTTAPQEADLVAAALSTLAFGLLAASILYGALAVWPQTKGPPQSFIFFGKITKRSAEQYVTDFLKVDGSELINDCLAQIHRNAEIATAKYGFVGRSIKFAFWGAALWLLAMIALMLNA